MDRTITLVALAALAVGLLPGCGSGATPSYDAFVTERPELNVFEQELVGVYSLSDFKLYATSVGIREPEAFDTWTGTLVLNSDRSGHIQLEMTPLGSTASEACERMIHWSATAGTLELVGVDGECPDAVATWDIVDASRIATHFYMPLDLPRYQIFLGGSGYEDFVWLRVD